MDARKQEIITFKADAALAQAMRGIANRSEFIRTAILAALDDKCPLCRGTGVLTTPQRLHWKAFSAHHPLVECDQCQALHPVCDGEPEEQPH